MRDAARRTMHLIRRLHLYAGLFLFPWVILYGVTAFLFNHPQAFPDLPVRSFGPDEVRGTALEHLPDPAETARRVVAELNRRAGGDKYRLVRPDGAGYEFDRVLVLARGDGQRYSVAIDLPHGTGHVRARPEPGKEADAPFAVPSGVAVDDPLPERLKRGVPEVLNRLGLPAGEVTIPGAPPALTFLMEENGRLWRVSYQAQGGRVSGKPAESAGARRTARDFLLQLHVAHGYPGAGGGTRWWWALAVDVVAALTVFWGLSGLLMAWQIKVVRRAGLVILLAGLAAAAAVGVGMYRVLAG